MCFLAGKKDCVQASELLGKHYASYESHELAFGFFNRAEALGSSLAYGRLGEYHLGAHGVVEKNETLAHEYFRKGVEKGDVYSCEWSALEAIKKTNRKEAVEMYRQANTPLAIYHLALLEESDELMVEAANLGYLPAMESLADSGEEEEDYDKMKLWLQRAAHWGCIGSAERLIAEYSKGKLFEKDLDKAVYYSIFLDDVADSTEIYQEQKREIAQLLSENSSFLEKVKSIQKKKKKKFRQQLDRLSPKHSAEFISELERKIGVEYDYYLNKISTQVTSLSCTEIGEIKEYHEQVKRYELKFVSRCNALGEKCLRDLEKKLAEELDEERARQRGTISAFVKTHLEDLKVREERAALPFQRAQRKITDLQAEANKNLSQSDSLSAAKRIMEAFQKEVEEVLSTLAPKTTNGDSKKEREIERLERQIEKERQKHASEVEQLRAEMAAQSRTSPTIKPVQHEKTGFLADYERCFTLLSFLDGGEYQGLQLKQLEKALNGEEWESVEQLGQLLERVGFEWEQNGTSHRVYRFPRNKELMISLSFDNKDRALVVYRKQVLNLLVKALEFYSTTI